VSDRVRLAVRVFAVLHWLLPARYRRRHGAESVSAFERMAQESLSRSGTAGLVRSLVSASLDLLSRVPAEHGAARRAESIGATRGSGGLMRRMDGLRSGIAQDVRYALRRLRREPGFAIFAALIIGLGIGANTAVFSVMSPLLIRSLPFREPERLVWVSNVGRGGLSSVTSRTSNLRDFRELNRTFESLTGYFAFFDYGSYTLVGTGEPERLVGVGIAQDFLDVLGVAPRLGRGFVDEESVWGGRAAAILTHDFWVRRFNARPDMVGQSITLNGAPTEVVRVLPSTFDFASTFTPASHIDFLLPFPISDETDNWGNTLAMVGRLRPGVTVAEAQADLDRVITQLQRDDPNRWGLGARVTGLRDHIAGEHRSAMLLLAAAAAAVMLVACANLSNLLLARGRTRSKEMAVRSALGAERRRLLRQLTIESLGLALAGGVVGVAVAWLIIGAVAQTSSVSIPMLRTVSMDGAVLLFALGITLVTGLLTGLAPVLQVWRGREAAAMRENSRSVTESRRSTTIREALVVGEMAAACVLLVGSGLLIRSFLRVLEVDLGYTPSGTVSWRVDTTRPFENAQGHVAYYDALTRRISELPGVESVGLTDAPPLGRNRQWGIRVLGVDYPDGQPSAFPRLVDRGYLEAMQIPLRSGRHFLPSDNAASRKVVILNQTAARALFPGQDALGRTVIIIGQEWEVIGIAGDVRHQALEEASGSEMYLPFTQLWEGGSPAFTLVVRSGLPLPSLVANVRGALRELDPSMATGDHQTLDAVVDQAISPRRFVLVILGGFAATALLLAALGIYAVLSYTVSQRIPEIGVRMALGESAAHVRWRIVRRTLGLALLGVVIGATLSAALTRLLQSMLFGVAPADPVTFGAMAALLLVVSAIAGFLPARRASATDPVAALRFS